jgi:hypothetical protein
MIGKSPVDKLPGIERGVPVPQRRSTRKRVDTSPKEVARDLQG